MEATRWEELEKRHQKECKMRMDSWIRNVMKVQNISLEKATELYNKIRPHDASGQQK